MDVWEDGYACNGGGTFSKTAYKLFVDGTVRLHWRPVRGAIVRQIIMSVGGEIWVSTGWADNSAAFTVSVRLLGTISLEVGEILGEDFAYGWFCRSLHHDAAPPMSRTETDALAALVNGVMLKLRALLGHDPHRFNPAGPPVSRETEPDPFKLTLSE